MKALTSFLAFWLSIIGICVVAAPALREQPDRRAEYTDSSSMLADEREVARIEAIQARFQADCFVQQGDNSAAVFVDGAAYCAVGRELKRVKK